jgi:hypothetical protein
MNAHDIDRGVPPQTHGSGRRRSPTRPWGAALLPTAVGGGQPPTPSRQGRAGPGPGGGARSGLTRASPPTSRPEPHPGPACARRRGVRAPRARLGRAPPPCPRQHAAAPRVGRPGVAALRAAPSTEGTTSGRLRGAGARDLVAAPPL